MVGPLAETAWGRTVWVDSIEEGFGGNGANTSYTLARLGARARLWGAVGSDDHGDRILAALASAGVETDPVRRSRLPTAASVVLVSPNGARALLHRPGASREAFQQSFELTGGVIGGCAWFHLANVFALPSLRAHAPELLAHARAAGMTVSIDTGWDARGEWIDVIGPCLAHADLLFVNEDEARELTGLSHPIQAARALQSRGVPNVIVKLGAAGCVLCLGEDSIASPAFQVPVVDTTGAGDCFVGGFLSAIDRGLPYSEAARFANAVGALSVQKLGSTTGLLGFDDTMAWAKAQQGA